MKILNIITRMEQGGSAENTLYTVISFQQKGHDSYLVSGATARPVDRLDEILRKHHIHHTVIPELVRSINPWKDLVAFMKLRRFIRKNSFDIVHTHTSKAGIVGRWAAWCAGVRTIIHTPHGHVFYGYYNTCVSMFFIVLEKLTARITTRIVCLTNGEINDYVRYGVSTRAACVQIHSGVTMGRFLEARPNRNAVRSSFGFTDNNRIMGTITRLEPIKGNQYLVKAWVDVVKHFPDARLLIIGEGTEKKYLITLIQELNVQSSIVLAGHRSDLPDVLSIMECFVLPSVNEGMGKVLIQAAAMSVPSIGSNVCGIPDIIKDGHTGFLVPPGDPDALARTMCLVLKNRRETAVIGQNAHAWVTGKIDGYLRFSKELMIDRLEKLYKECVPQ